VRLKDKVALVTGGGRGIGRDIVLAYAREGANVVVNDVDPATAASTAKDAAGLGSKSLAVVADIAKSADITHLVETIIKERGRIDIVVNNAMKIVPGKLEALPEAAWDTTVNIGLKGAFLVSQAAAKHMIAQKSGAIVNIASIAGLLGQDPRFAPTAAYTATKHGVVGLTRQLAAEWGIHGITVNAICPGFFPSKMTQATLATAGELVKEWTPTRRLGNDEDLKGLAVLLASEASRHINGQAIAVDGGAGIV